MNPEDIGTYYESILDKEVRKAGGIYYTPPPIVDYMVNEVLNAYHSKGACLLANTNIVDPSCGAGIFLLGAYRHLLDLHEKHFGKLTLTQRYKILTENIFGVDIDPLAVKITKYSLSMECSEGTDFSLNLDKNIRCGDSLMDDEFCWNSEFPGIFLQGGFDIVIGNPPYIQLQKDGGRLASKYQNCKFWTFERTGDIYTLFYERGHQLLNEGGHLCFITSNKWMRTGYGESLRKFLSKNTTPKLLIDFAGTKIFESATVDTNILLFRKEKSKKKTQCCIVNKENIGDLKSFIKQNSVKCSFTSGDAWVILSPIEQRIKQKIESVGIPLKDWDLQINFGIKTGFNEAFIIDGTKRKELIKQDRKSKEIIKPLLRGRNIKRYGYEFANLWLICTFPALQVDIEKYPAVKEHLLSFGKNRLEQSGKRGARKKSNNKWFETQDTISFWQDFDKPKIVYSEIVQSPQFYLDKEGKFFPDATAFVLSGEQLSFLYGLLHTNAVTYFFKTFYAGGGLGEDGYRYKKRFLELLPIPKPDNATAKKMENLVDKIMLQKQEGKDTTSLERKIDALVYELYGLTDEEIAVVEGKS